MTDIEPIESHSKDIVAGGATDALATLAKQAQAMGDAYKLAEVMCHTDMVPKQYRNKPNDGAAAILYGAELGMNAIQSLQNVMVINGKPGIEARTMVALLKRKGYRFTTDEQTDATVTVTGTSPSGESETSTWDIDRATKAGFTSNALYKKIPAQMLYAKAATEVCRKLAPDVLLGIANTAEDLRLMGPVIEQATATRVRKPQASLQEAVSKTTGGGMDDALAAVDKAVSVEALEGIYSHAVSRGFSEEDLQDLAVACADKKAELEGA